MMFASKKHHRAMIASLMSALCGLAYAGPAQAKGRAKAKVKVKVEALHGQFERVVDDCVHETWDLLASRNTIRNATVKTGDSFSLDSDAFQFSVLVSDICQGMSSYYATQSIAQRLAERASAPNSEFGDTEELDVSACGDGHAFELVAVQKIGQSEPTTWHQLITEGVGGEVAEVPNGSVSPLPSADACALSHETKVKGDGRARIEASLPWLEEEAFSATPIGTIVADLEAQLAATPIGPASTRVNIIDSGIDRLWIDGTLVSETPGPDNVRSYDSATRYPVVITGSLLIGGEDVLPQLVPVFTEVVRATTKSRTVLVDPSSLIE